MLGAQRRIEARIGQLLGEASHVPGSSPHAEDFSDEQRHHFRLLARGRDNWYRYRPRVGGLMRFAIGWVIRVLDLGWLGRLGHDRPIRRRCFGAHGSDRLRLRLV